MISTRRTRISAIAIAAGIGAVVALGACGGGGGTPNATQIVQANGFTPVSLASLGGSASDITSAFPSGDISSLAIGVQGNPATAGIDGSEYQMVVVTTPQGQTDIANTGDVQNEESQVASTGANMTYNNGVVTLTGTLAQFDNLPSS